MSTPVNKQLKILIACELSGTVRDAFIAKGHNAISCDILPSDSEGPHYIGDVRDILYDSWDMIIAHPPCTYLSKAGARWLHAKGQVNQERYKQGIEAKEFFNLFFNHPCPLICIENPTPLKIFNLPEPTQVIQPYQFGHPYSKRTLLWLKGLPELKHTDIVDIYKPFLPSNTGGKKRGQSYSIGISKNAKESSKTFSGVAAAMANQWG